MFKPTGTQTAKNEDGIIVEIDGYILRYIDGDHVLEFGSEPGMPTSTNYAALFTVYFPTTQLHWQAPHQGEGIDIKKSVQIEKHIEEAMEALHCELVFTTPVTQ